MSRPDNKCETENYVEDIISLIRKAVANIKGFDNRYKQYDQYNYTDLTDKEKIVLKHCVFLADRESGMYTMYLPNAAIKRLNQVAVVNEEQRVKAFYLLHSWKTAIENSSPILGEDLKERKEYRKKILRETKARVDALNAEMAALNEESGTAQEVGREGVRRVSFEGEEDDTKVATDK
jgi:hypothetical protein